MSATQSTSPFSGADPGYIPLSNSPLVRTIAQIRFPELSAFAVDEEVIANRVVASLAASYPLLSVDYATSVTFTSDGATESQSEERLWRLTDAGQTWQVTFGRRFLSLDTSTYVRRRDFADRLTTAWRALNEQIEAPYIERLGIRYVNYVRDGAHLAKLDTLVRPEIFGVDGTSAPWARLTSALSEARYRFDHGSAFDARWGLLMPGMTLDPSLPTSPDPMWVLDMDSYRDLTDGPVIIEDLYEATRELALRGYQFFRWAVTKEFLKTFGGEVE